MDTRTAILSRYACREFSTEQLTEADCTVLLEAACAAPASMGDYSGIKLTIIQSPEMRSLIEQETAHFFSSMGAHPTYEAPTLFLISAKISHEFAMLPYCNAACMAENIMVQATALGLASVYIMAVPTAMQQKPELLKQLSIPEEFSPIVMVAVGKAKKKRESAKVPTHQVEINRI